MKPFFIYNTLHRKVEEFDPLVPELVTYYSCGPTVYLPQHLGNMRAFLVADTLKRALQFNGYKVEHVMNVTDVGHMTSDQDAGEDKVEKTARAQGKSPREVADFYTEMFKADLERLGAEPPTVLCRASDHIPEMQALIGRILANGFAYVAHSAVYFDVEKYRGTGRVGRLSRQSLDEQDAAQRLAHAGDKKSPHDFALWVLNQPTHLMQWDSPWGRGYPGWHIECSAMAMKYLGETIDLHSGGLDHIPVHHENEIAQSESATGKPFVRYFVHNAFLTGTEGAKISKSAGHFPLLDDLVAAGFDPLAFRLLCLGSKYRSELAFNMLAVEAAQKNLDYFSEFAAAAVREGATALAPAAWTASYAERFHEAINNDLNTPQALAVALELVAEAYRREDKSAWHVLASFDSVLGLRLEQAAARARDQRIPEEVRRLVEARSAARARREFRQADEIRNQLAVLGYEVKDTPNGPLCIRRPAQS